MGLGEQRCLPGGCGAPEEVEDPGERKAQRWGLGSLLGQPCVEEGLSIPGMRGAPWRGRAAPATRGDI